MESEHSYTGESSGSGSSSGSSDSEDDTLEPVNILGRSLELPQDLCEDYGIFKEFFSMKTWNSLEDEHKEHLKKFLPTFRENDKEEKEKTVEMLFDRETFHFTSPLNHFYHNLSQGNYRPDIAKMKKFLMKARAKQQRQKIKSYYSKLLPDVLLSRERLLAVAKDAPPGPILRLPSLARRQILKPHYQSPQARAKQRYFEELAAIRSEVGGEESDDDNYPEGPTAMSARRRKQSILNTPDTTVMSTLGGNEVLVRSSLGCLKNILAAHSARRQYKDTHPELNTTGITLEDVKLRVSLVNGNKKLMFGSQKIQESPIQKLRRAPKKEYVSKAKEKNKIIKKEIDSEININSVECNKQIVPNITIKHEVDSELDVSHFVEPIKSPKQIKKEIKEEKMDDIELKVADVKREPIFKPSKEVLPEMADVRIIQEKDIVTPASRNIKQPVPLSLEDLDGIDMMALPIELAEECEIPNEASNSESEFDESLMQTTYQSFFSMVRALFPAKAAHRASVSQLRAKCATLMKSPIAPLNTWYTQSDNWCAELDSALEFLSGEKGLHTDDFVPFLQHMKNKDQRLYQWIGAGRDCDGNLSRLCERWIKSRTAPKPQPVVPIVIHDIPPARCPTVWKVRTPTTMELMEFREQELRRFSVVAKPYSYVQFGYQSVVGPWSVRASACASQATLLRNNRPRHATFTALLRDAVARLPNGEGTKQDIITLLKMSQWIMPVNDQTLLTSVTAALDRLHAAKREPMVKYDPRTNLWTYLYRHRSEEDWNKPVTARSRTKLPTGQVTGTTISLYKEVQPPPPPPVSMEMEVASIEEVVENASDSDVDVEDGGIGNAQSNLSSAQLLIQATKAKLQEQKLKQNPQVNQTINRQPAQTVRKELVTIPPTPVKQMKPKVCEVVKKVGPTIPPTQLITSPVNKPKPKVERTIIAQTSPLPIQRPKTIQPIAVTQPKPAPNSIIRPTLVKQRAATPLHNAVPGLTPTLVQTVVTTSIHTTPISATNIQHAATTQHQLQTTTKVVQANRSLLIRPTPTPSTTVSATAVPSPSISAQMANRGRRGVVRVLSPATNSTGKSLISPRALLQTTQVNQVNAAIKRKPLVQTVTAMTTGIQNSTSLTTVAGSHTTVVNSQPTAVSASVGTRTVHLANGRTVQLASGQTVQLASGHTLLSSLPVRLPSGQTVQLAAPRTKSIQSLPNMQTVQLTGHTVKLPSGQSVQVASQTGQVQLPSGQTVNALQLGQNVQIPNTVQLTGQTVQLASGQTVQLPSGQTLQLQSGQTVQLSSGQAIQLSSGQTVQLANQKTQHIVRSQSSGEKTSQPIVAKLLTNAQGQMISLEGMVGGTRTLQIAGVRPQGQKTLQGSMRVVSSGGNRVARPVLLTSAKPLHNLILQSDGSTVRVTSSGGTTPTQTLVLASQSGATTSNSTPVLKLQQVNSIQHIKLSQGIKIQQSGSSTSSSGNVSTVRSVVMDGQHLKLVGGKHVLARLLRPANPP